MCTSTSPPPFQPKDGFPVFKNLEQLWFSSATTLKYQCVCVHVYTMCMCTQTQTWGHRHGRTWMERHTDTHTDIGMDGWTDGRTHRHTHTHAVPKNKHHPSLCQDYILIKVRFLETCPDLLSFHNIDFCNMANKGQASKIWP